MDEKILAKAQTVIAKKAEDHGLKGDLSIIIAIIMAILQAMGGCFQTPAQIKKSLKSKTVAARVATTIATKNALNDQFGPGAYFKHNGPAFVEVVLEVGGEADENDIAAMRAMAS